MPDLTELHETFKRQRHEFILHYYDMAVKDLERHLQVGWQSISFAAGVIAVLSAGQQNYLPIPLAVMAALAISFWGVHNIFDADLWARRAIGFLANVEAVYFTVEDRRFFNPYAGFHPSTRMLGSLKSQMMAAGVFVVLTLLFFSYASNQHAQNFLRAGNQLSQITHLKFAFWLSPIALLIFLLVMTVRTRRKRIADYTEFVVQSPGPGMVKNPTRWRGINLKEGDATPSDIIPGEEIQGAVRIEAESTLQRWDRYVTITQVVAGLAVVALVLVDIFQRCILS